MANAPPLYYPTSLAAGAGGELFIPTLFRGAHRVSTDPVQRSGHVPDDGAWYQPTAPALSPPGMASAAVAPAAHSTIPIPAPVQIGGPRDPNFWV